MGLLDDIFKGKSQNTKGEKKQLLWLSLTTEEQLQHIKALSKTKPQLIFKHSTRCGISRMVLSQFEKEFSLAENQMDLYYLDLLNYRSVSDAIATIFDIEHQSPQVLIIKNESVVAHDSHSGITNLDLLGY